MNTDNIEHVINQQDIFFRSGVTKEPAFRIKQLKTLDLAIHKYEDAIIEACAKDMGKPEQESVMGEVSLSLSHNSFAIKNLPRWLKPKKVKTPLGHLPGKTFTIPEPYGRVLVMAPWNYPFHLAIVPLIGSMAAGNCSVVKPSEITSNVSNVIEKMISEFFDPEYITVVQGDAVVAQSLIEKKWDLIFFTGSPHVGSHIMKEAANHLTPVVLELGGKSPCIVDKDVNLNVAVKRIFNAKYFNNGQSCVSPDYLLVHTDIKEEFIQRAEKTLKAFYGNYNQPNNDLSRIINERHFDRLVNLITPNKVIFGGAINRAEKFIGPTLLEIDNWDDKIMQDEIFGPLFPFIVYNDLNAILKEINQRPKPLTLYLYTQNKKIQDKVLNNTSSGTLVINDSLVQFAIIDLPFGGVGSSGMGVYHGKAAFETFSHQKSVLKKRLWFDVPQRFAPYKLSRKQAAWLFKFFSG